LGSPLAIGIGEGVFCSSDASPFIEYTQMQYIEDGEMAIIRLHKSMKEILRMILW
jgi:glucosamine--fructose-6-phosphate aminotransferase (isomerizing)